MKIRSVVLAGFVFILATCATGSGTPPGWISESSGRSERGERIIVFGSGVNASEAERALSRDLESQVSRVLVDGAVQRGLVIDDQLALTIEAIAATRSADLQGDRFIRSDGSDREQLYLLVLYTTEMIEADLDQIENAAIDTSPTEPQQGTNEVLWTELVLAVTDPPPTTYEDRFQRLTEARRIADSIDLSIISSVSSTSLSNARSPRISANLRFATPTGSEYMPFRTDMRFVETAPIYDGERQETTEELEIVEGVVSSITAAPPDLSGSWQYRVEPIWLESAIDRWTTMIADEPERRRTALAGLISGIEKRLRARVTVQVTSSAINIPTAVIILDRDIAGNPIDGDIAARNAVRRFDDLGFRARFVQLEPEARRQLSDRRAIDVETLYDILPFDVLSMVDRAVIGWADILTFDEGESFSVAVGVEVDVFDLRRDQVLTSLSLEERTAGGDAQSAIRAAFSSAGRRAADLLAPRLP